MKKSNLQYVLVENDKINVSVQASIGSIKGQFRRVDMQIEFCFNKLGWSAFVFSWQKVVFLIQKGTSLKSEVQNVSLLLETIAFFAVTLLFRQPCWALILEDFSRLVSLYICAKSWKSAVLKKALPFITWVSLCLTHPKSYTLTHCKGNRQVTIRIPWSSAAFFCIFSISFFHLLR